MRLLGRRPNNSFKPNLFRSTKHMAEKACHVFGSATQVGLTQALDHSMSNCAICQAPLPHCSAACIYAVPESEAPWRGDYAAMHRGDITHLEHKTHVARWSLHNASSQTEKSLVVFRALAFARAGQPIPLFVVGEARA